jgi:TRAP-type C4-dicarboxylate transport system permease small subunit
VLLSFRKKGSDTLKKLNKILTAIENAVISIDSVLLIAITGIIMVQVVARKISVSIPGTEELARFSYVIFAFLAWPIAALRGTDIQITFLFDKLPKNPRKYLLVFFHVLMSIFAAICVYSMTKNIANAGEVVAASNRWFKLKYLYYIVEFGLIATTVFHWIRIFFLLTGQAVYISQEEKDIMEIEAAKADYEAHEAHRKNEGGSTI